MKDAVGQKSLLDIYTVYEKLMKGKPGAGEKTSTPAAASASAPDENTKEEAEKLKSQGNAAIQKKDYTSAIDFYTKALDLIPLNPIYLSNRAAAYSGSGQHEEAVNDAEMAVAADPKFSKAWSRLGFAKYALGDAKGSLEAYEQGIAAEGNGGSTAMRKGYETAKRKVEEEGDYEDDDEDEVMGTRGVPGAGGMPDLSSLAGMFGGGGGGGMPDLGSMMQNPMMRQMAQSLMSNPESMSALLNNPALRGMMGGGAPGAGGEPGPPGAGRGGGMPDLASLMQDPALMDM
jgi:small glutamine-rich tetratricopeptide repeat-containing protein alpha